MQIQAESPIDIKAKLPNQYVAVQSVREQHFQEVIPVNYIDEVHSFFLEIIVAVGAWNWARSRLFNGSDIKMRVSSMSWFSHRMT